MAPNHRDYCHDFHKKRQPVIVSKLQDPPKFGEIICDVSQKKWKLGRCIGVGAFGEVYLASDDISKVVGNEAQFVVKVEPLRNGPLFVEQNFYLRAAKPELIEEWQTGKKIKYLGIPKLLSFGLHSVKAEKYRFIVLPRYGENVHKLFLEHSKKFHVKTALTIATHLIDILEYIHSKGYIHLDVKGLNILMGNGNGEAPLYLVDYGLVSFYNDETTPNRDCIPDPRKAEAGTTEYLSRDAHIGVMSRRSDLESLGYNLVHWLSGHLPWLSDLTNSELVASLKDRAMDNIKSFLHSTFSNHIPSVLVNYLEYVKSLESTSKPNYDYCRQLFAEGIRDAGFEADKKITFDSHAKLKFKIKKRKAEVENEVLHKKIKLKPVYTNSRRPCSTQNLNTVRVTRNQVESGIKLRSAREFDWATILAGHPEKDIKFQQKKEKTKQSDSSNGVDNNGNVTTKGVNSLSNPTPAMLTYMHLKKTPRRKHSESSRLSSSNYGTPSYLTPAMEKVIANMQLVTPFSPKLLRSSKRRTVKQSIDAIFACSKS